MSDDDFYIPTGEELDRGEVPRREPQKRGPLRRLRRRRAAWQADLEVPEDVGRRRWVRELGHRDEDQELLDTGSTGRIVRSIDATDAAHAQRDLIVPPELRDKYGLDE